MITERGSKYFVSDWSACDCHLNSKMFEAMIRISNEFVKGAIGVVHRDCDSGFIKIATVYNDDITYNALNRVENRIKELLAEEYAKTGEGELYSGCSIKIYRYSDLPYHGYSEKDIRYCFYCGNIFLRQ